MTMAGKEYTQGPENTNIISIPAGVQISAFLRRSGIRINTPCGGRGNCGKCRVRVLEGEQPVMRMDRVHLSPEELDAGARLACQAMTAEPLKVEICLSGYEYP